MRTAKSVTITLDPAEYERLEAQARRCGKSPSSLAQGYVQAGLAADQQPDTERRWQAALEALDRLSQITADLPPVNAVRIARASRRELERRPRL